jgi:Inner membrane protein YgaP-like, transmembrane domain
MKNNEASWDRIVRVIGGAALIIAGFTIVGGIWAWILAILGLVFLVTGLIGWCPIYSALRVGTYRDDTTREAA